MGQIIVEDYLEEFEVKSKSGDLIGVVRFNPSDEGIVDRYNTLAQELGTIKQLPDESEYCFKKRAEKEIANLIDYVLNQKCSDVFFSVASPLSLMASGNTYCEAVLDGIAEAIENASETRLKRVRTKVDKYAKKYHK